VTAVEDGPVRELPPVHVLPIGEIRESGKNARRIPDRAVELVALSLRRFGWKQPLVVDGDRNLIAGHTRYRAARTLGLTRVPAVMATDLTPAEVDAYRIADNRTHDFTTWDLPELAVQLAELEEDFADVLALTDWEALTAGHRGGGDLDLDLPPSAATALDGGFQLNVCFTSKEEALAAEETLLNLPGVFDVRHDF
jgi:ParB-like chromosome segregation protein Spo0J